AAEVEPGGGGEVPRLLPVEDVLDVDHAATLERERDAAAPKLHDEEGEVEAPDVESRQVALLEDPGEPPRSAAEGLLVRNIRVGDPVHGGCLRRDRHLRVEAANPLEHVPLRRHLDERQLDDAVLLEVEARRLQIEEDEGAVQLER